MHKRDKTITFKGNGSLFIPRNLIRSEYPETNDNDGNNRDDNLFLGYFYTPDAFTNRNLKDENGLPPIYNTLEEALSDERYISNQMNITALYKNNNLDKLKCIAVITLEENNRCILFGTSDYVFYPLSFTEYYCLGQLLQ